MINSLEKNPDYLKKPYLEIEKLVQIYDEKNDEDDLEIKSGKGETIIHHLVEEGYVEILKKLLDLDEHPKIEKSKLVEALTLNDEAGWTPVMAAVKSDRNAEEILNLLLTFLEKHADTNDVAKLIKPDIKVSIYHGFFFRF